MSTPPRSDRSCDGPTSIAELGALMGDPVRAAILLALSDGSMRPAGELACLAGASPQAASAHLARLVDGGLLAVERQGRHRFFKIASGEVAERLEDLSNWVETPRRVVRHDAAMRHARLCYDHIAGGVGVAVFDRMVEGGLLVLGHDGPSLGEAGKAWCCRHGLGPMSRARGRRPLVRLCLDATERRHHLGGHLGAAITGLMLERSFLAATPHGRALTVTSTGARFLRDELQVDVARMNPDRSASDERSSSA